ncbi:ORC4-C domain-containing protein [Aphelenchoides besseyi]|nr:ORC4-C domain-containing protein [Aphelenchoides besseyi]
MKKLQKKLNDYDVFMSSLSGYLVNLEDVENELKERLRIVRNENSGMTMMLLGPRSSGKRSLINQVMKNEASDMLVIIEDGEFGDTRDSKEWTQATEEAFRNKEKKVVVVLHNFDRINVSIVNKVLYWFSQQQRLVPYLLILVSENADARQVLEKRIDSRIGQNLVKIAMNRRELEDDWKLVCKMISKSAESCSQKFQDSISLPRKPPIEFVECWNQTLCDSTPYARFKIFAVEFIDKLWNAIDEEKLNDEAEMHVFDEKISKVDTVEAMLWGISNRMYGILIAAADSRKQRIDEAIPVEVIRQRFIWFNNTNNIREPSLVFSDGQFQTDIDYLVSRGFFTAKVQNDQIMFVYWQADPLVLLDPKHQTPFHQTLKNWISDRLKDTTHLL